MSLYIGCPIWANKDWVGSLFPEGTKPKEFLREYARRLTTVEGNTTFYAVPSLKTVQEWAAEMPGTFRFCPKLPRLISHTGKLVEHIPDAEAFIQAMRPLGMRLGPMFLQLPPRYPPDWFPDLRTFLEAWPAAAPLGVEVRHPDWFDPPHNSALNDLLAARGMARVIIDTRPIRSLLGDRILAGSVYERLLQARQRKPDVPVLAVRTASFTFLRYIGHPRMDDNEPFLREWSQTLAGWLGEGAQAYVFCHCPDERLDPWLCRRLHQLIAARLPIPPLPWDEADAGVVRQARLF